MNYETRIIKVIVVPKDEPIYSELATAIEIQDESPGEFVKVTQEGGHSDYAKSICFDPEGWPAVRSAIDDMILKCRKGKDV
jgi:hypothetical protein